MDILKYLEGAEVGLGKIWGNAWVRVMGSGSGRMHGRKDKCARDDHG
jgi:hypothetical protein